MPESPNVLGNQILNPLPGKVHQNMQRPILVLIGGTFKGKTGKKVFV